MNDWSVTVAFAGNVVPTAAVYVTVPAKPPTLGMTIGAPETSADVCIVLEVGADAVGAGVGVGEADGIDVGPDEPLGCGVSTEDPPLQSLIASAATHPMMKTERLRNSGMRKDSMCLPPDETSYVHRSAAAVERYGGKPYLFIR